MPRFHPGDMIRLRKNYWDNEYRAGHGGLLTFNQVVQCEGTKFNDYDQEMIIYFDQHTGLYVDGWLAERFELVEEDLDPEGLLGLL